MSKKKNRQNIQPKAIILDQDKDKKSLSRFNGSTKQSIRVLVCIGISLFIIPLAFREGIIRGYKTAKDDASASTFQTFYEKSYEIGESNYHLSNRGILTLGSIREISDLEVLSISDVQYVKTDIKNKEIWCKFPGDGVFTIDLSKGDFLIDNERHSITVKIPHPQLKTSNIFIEDSSVVCHEYGPDKGILGIFDNGSVKDGMSTGLLQRKLAIEQIRQNIESNESYYRLAEISGKSLLTGMIQSINIDIDDLTINVEYF